MTSPPRDGGSAGDAALHGADLVAALERRFVTRIEAVPLGARAVPLLRPRSAEELINEEDFDLDERLPYWAELWPSALVLAGVLAGEAGAGRRCLELGCGLGLVTVAAMAAGYQVRATDYYADALAFTRANAWRLLGREPATELVDWRRLPGTLGHFERVLAADVLYERPSGALVARAVAAALAPGGRATVADPGRVGVEGFLAECAGVGLALTGREELPCAANGVVQRIHLYTLRRSPPGDAPGSGGP